MKSKSLLGGLALLSTFLLHAAEPARVPQQGPVTTPERTEYKATSTLSEVQSFYEALCAQHPGKVILSELGRSAEGRVIPLVILGDPAVAAPQDNGRPVLLIVANIHGGEV